MTAKLSKSRFLSGLQCHKQLWWRVHEPAAPELQSDENTRVLFETGAQVGAAAREFVPGGTLVLAAAHDNTGKLEQTAAALAAGAPVIYEATFQHGDVIASIDILERTPGGHRLTEVKSTVEAKDEHVADAAIQTWVLQGSGHEVTASHLMHLNRECRAPDLSNLFARADVGPQVAELLPAIPAQVKGMLRVLEGPLPDVPIGDHCDEPQECPFKVRCWPEPIPHDVENLRGISPKKRAAFQSLGVKTIDQIPADFELTDFQAIQRAAVLAGRMLVGPELPTALKAFDADKIAFLDFETVSPAIPIWNGTGPYAQMPAQFSCHVAVGRSGGQAAEHHAWVADGPEDPRPAFARAVIEACRGADVVVAFNATFEKQCLKGLAEALPDQAAELKSISDRMRDLATPIQKGMVYHPDFNGRYSLKVVVPILIPELAYTDLDVADGKTASNRLLAFMLNQPAQGPEEREVTKAQLLKYCERDTLVMVRLLEKLRELASRV